MRSKRLDAALNLFNFLNQTQPAKSKRLAHGVCNLESLLNSETLNKGVTNTERRISAPKSKRLDAALGVEISAPGLAFFAKLKRFYCSHSK